MIWLVLLAIGRYIIRIVLALISIGMLRRSCRSSWRIWSRSRPSWRGRYWEPSTSMISCVGSIRRRKRKRKIWRWSTRRCRWIGASLYRRRKQRRWSCRLWRLSGKNWRVSFRSRKMLKINDSHCNLYYLNYSYIRHL